MRLNTIKPAPGAKRPRLRVGRGPRPAKAKPAAAASRASAHARAGITRWASRAARCPCSADCPRQVSARQIKATRAEVRLSDLEALKAGLIDLKALIEAKVVPVHTERAKVIQSGELK